LQLEADTNPTDPKAAAEYWRWAQASPEHTREALLTGALDDLLAGIDPERQIDVAALERDGGNVIPLPLAAGAAPGKRETPWPRALAAGVVLVLLLGSAVVTWHLAKHSGAPAYLTGAGEERTIALPDGSTVVLDTQSRVRVRFSAHSRDLDLDGQAVFRVAHDTARPFRVHAGGSVIQAVGTEFNVRTDGGTVVNGGTVVSVLEGVVQISPEGSGPGQPVRTLPAAPVPLPAEQGAGGPLDAGRVAAGQAVTLSTTGEITHRALVDVAAVTAWQQRQLIFTHVPLPQIVREFNRYSSRRTLRVEGARAQKLTYGGIFDATDPSPLLEFVAKDPTLVLEQHGNEIVIRDRAGS